MSLASIQREMARAVMTPLTPSDHMRAVAADGRSLRKVAGKIIKPNDRLTSFERLEIYNRQYWYRVLSNMQEDFPGLCAILGDRKFVKMSEAYLVDCPSQSFTLRNLGSRLEAWLRKHPKWAGTKQALALDMVRLEWADIEAFDSKAEEPLRAEELHAGADEDLRLRLQPYVRLLALAYPVDDLVLAVKKESDGEFASNAFDERRKKKRVGVVARLKPEAIYLAVHRLDYSVYFRRLEREEILLLKALGDGKTLGAAIGVAFKKSSIPLAERPENIEVWFRNWAALGWFCSTNQRPGQS
jgi:hypothetical protein